jgi:AAHS family 4-hydroxybenzoate transporter-like MFS transporter
LGGAVPLACAWLQWLALPESPRFLAQNSRHWPSLERLLRRMGRTVPMGSAFHDSIERGPRGRAPIRVLLGSALGRDTAGLWLAFLFCLGGGVYLVFSWLPAMLAGQGVDVASASRALAVYNMGGVAGVLIWAGLVTWLGSRGPLLAGSLASAASALAILFAGSHAGGSQTVLFAGLAVNGLLTNAVQTSLFALAAHLYPTSVRSSGIAYAAAIGRLGGVASSLGGAAIIAMA